MLLRIHSSNAHKRSFLTYLLLAFMGLLSTPTSAKDYKIEALVFAHNNATAAYEKQPYSPPQEPRNDAEYWPLEASMLLQLSSQIESSPDYQLLRYLSWGQEALPLSESTARQLLEADVSGWIKVYANQLLFANIDLDVQGYRMVEKRRLKLDELHYFDHPKFGVLLQVSRLESPAENDQ
ncbi:MAG: hypothetical protein HKN50_05950 [Gammaproteobacteria bacterium]|nr:hypothetical protein [Gammaproteobacteria bacterium]